MKITDIITDRGNKLSPYKLSFLAGAFSMLFAIIKISLETGKLIEVPQTWVYFLLVLGGSQLTSTYLKTQEIETLSKTTTKNKKCICIHLRIQIGDNESSNNCPLHKNDPPATKLIRTSFYNMGQVWLTDEVIRLRRELRKYEKPEKQPKGKVKSEEINAALSHLSKNI